MNPSNSDSNSPRVTLKLKAGARKAPQAAAQAAPTSPAPRPPSKAQQKPGAHWSDEYKQRMQADMDALTSR